MTPAPPPSPDDVGARAIGPVLRALASRPWLWPAALAQTMRMARPGWWRRWPPVPVPDAALWRFRIETAYGGRGDHTPEEPDIVSFIDWSRAMRRWRQR